MATRADAIERVREHLHSGEFLGELDRRVAYQTESQNSGQRRRAARLSRREPAAGLRRARFLDAADRIRRPAGGRICWRNIARMLRADRAHLWPWRRRRRHGRRMARQPRSMADDDQRRARLWPRHGRQQGPAQHQPGGAARGARDPRRQARLQCQIHHRDRRGDRFAGSAPGLRSPREELSADLFLASDGPRLSAERPTIFLGCRGGIRIHLDVNLRDGGHHSGNWGGVLANPATILCERHREPCRRQGADETRGTEAAADLERSPRRARRREDRADRRSSRRCPRTGARKVSRQRSGSMPGIRWKCSRCRRAVSQSRPTRSPVTPMPCCSCGSSSAPDIKRSSTPYARICMPTAFRWSRSARAQSFAASRTDVDSPWVNWTANSIRKTTGKAPAVLPNFGGSLPNDVFSEGLGLPTIWVPHSYPGCSQHAPDEHILLPVTEEALAIMAGLFWDLGEIPHKS